MLKFRSLSLLAAVALAAALGAQIYDAVAEGADRMAHQMIDDMKASGMMLTRDDQKRMEAYYRHHEAIQAMRRQVVETERKARAAGMTAQADALVKQKASLDVMFKNLPKPPPPGSHNMYPGFNQQLENWSRLTAAGEKKRVEAVETQVKTVKKQIQDRSAGAGGSGGGGARPTGGSNWVVLIESVSGAPGQSGSVEFQVNGQSVTRARQEIRVSRGAPILVRAVAIDPRRAMIRSFQETAQTSLEGNRDDYTIAYRTKAGSFNGKSVFSMASESYNWSVQLGGDRDADYKVGDSKIKPGLSKDLVTITYGTQVTASFSVQGEVNWQFSSQRPAGNRTGAENGKASGTLKLRVMPD